MDKRTYILAPLAGYTDVPYRLACRSQGCKYAYTALIDAGALVHGNPDNNAILQRDPSEEWLGVQLLGGIPEDVAKSAKMLKQMEYDSYDFNMGCPMQKVVKRPAGAGLLKAENQGMALQCAEIVRNIISDKPFTVKLRVLDFTEPEPTVVFCRKLQEIGVDGITLHGRLAESIYSGPVAVNVIRAVREELNIPVTANGGIFSIEDANALADATGCERLMVARGSLGNPWIFRELNDGKYYAPESEELCDVLERHVLGMLAVYGEKKAMLLARKIAVAYLRGRGYSKTFRIRATMLSTEADFRGLMADIRQLTFEKK